MCTLKSTALFLSVLAALAIACGDAPLQATPTAMSALTPGPMPAPPPSPTPAGYTVATPAPTADASLPRSSFRGRTVALSLEFASGRVAPGRQFVLEVQVDPEGRGISGVQFGLHFPPQEVEVLDVYPGPLLGPEPLEIKGPGDGPGVFRYAAARTGETLPPTPRGRVATIRLRALDGVAAGTNLRLWLQDVKVAEPAGDTFRAVVEVTVSPALTLVATPS